MMGTKSSLSSVLMIVAFIVLIAIASVVYSGDAGQDANAEQSALYGKVKSVLTTLWTAAEGVAGINFIKNTNLAPDAPDAATLASPSHVSDLWTNIKEEWQKGGETGADFALPNVEDIKEKLKSLLDF